MQVATQVVALPDSLQMPALGTALLLPLRVAWTSAQPPFLPEHNPDTPEKFKVKHHPLRRGTEYLKSLEPSLCVQPLW